LGRQRRADDERAIEVTLTDEGAALRERVADVPVQISQALALTADETGALRDLLRKVQAGASAHSGRYASNR
jgi:DNA-binding MarR family transcriptional regulator